MGGNRRRVRGGNSLGEDDLQDVRSHRVGGGNESAVSRQGPGEGEGEKRANINQLDCVQEQDG